MRPLIAIDWGTSSLRAALLDPQGAVLEERSMARGILTVAPNEFPSVFATVTAQWRGSQDALCLLSGMVGSRQGWVEAPYCPCPAGFADIAARLTWVEPGRIAIVPGLRCDEQGVPDVLRGEETQVFGALALLGLADAVVVLPGTHSKWVRVAQGRIRGFSTFMTGEFYALLRRHSILARSLPQADGELDEEAFQDGFEYALRQGNLLRTAFSIRTLSLFDRLPATALPSYLSGLVIGEELRSQALGPIAQSLVVVGSPELTRRYLLALQMLGVRARHVGSEASWRGLWAIATSLEAET